MVTNADRAYRIESTMAESDAYSWDTDDESIVDILTDMRHHCHQNGLNMAQLLASSEINFNAEVKEESK